MKFIKIIFKISIFSLLTLVTQIGGLAYLASLSTNSFICKHCSGKYLQRFLKFGSFIFIYCFTTFLVVPIIAKQFGRVQLPIGENNHLRPLNLMTCILNRNYVRPELRQTAFDVAQQMNKQYPGTVLNYLDANFPFFNKFPLYPHLSHSDGKKLDLAFCYTSNTNYQQTNECPSIIGYGICEEPLSGETNTTAACEARGYHQYSLLRKLMPQSNKKYYEFDGTRTKSLVNLFAANPDIGKIFIEPHLKTRLGLTTEKIRFHGCQAVRHDDHIHVQLK